MLRNMKGSGGVGGGMMTFCALDHMLDATQHHSDQKPSSLGNTDLGLSDPELQWEFAQHVASP